MYKKNDKPKVVIMGGGLAGLSAAWKLLQAGISVEIVEKEKIVGGMAATIKYQDFLFDYGGHRFITKRQDVLSEIKQLMGKEFFANYRKTQYLLWGKRLNYPLEIGDLIKKINPLLSLACLLDYFYTRVKSKFVKMPEDNFESWVVKRFGRRLYNLFFGMYTAKIWGLPPTKISADWASQRISILNLWDAAKQLFFKPKEDPRTYTRKYYYCRHGIGQIAKFMAKEILKNKGKIHLNSQINQINLSKNKVQSISFLQSGKQKTIKADVFISTIPLTDVVQIISPQAPKQILQAARKLRYRAICFLFMTLDQKQISDNDALYITDPRYIFFRIEQYKYWSAKMVPTDKKTSLCLEITCFKDDNIWKMKDDILFEKAVEGLIDAKLLSNKNVIKDYFIHRKNYIYPVFEIGYKPHAKKIREYADSIPNLIAYGRQGYYQYIHMHHVIGKGFKAAEYIISGKNRGAIQQLGSEEEYFG